MKLIDVIIEILNKEDIMSISELHRRMRKKGIKTGKLILTGYLYALADLEKINLYAIDPTVGVSLRELNLKKKDSSCLIENGES